MIAYERNECTIKKNKVVFITNVLSLPLSTGQQLLKQLIFELEIMETIKSSSNGKQLKSISIEHAAISLFTP